MISSWVLNVYVCGNERKSTRMMGARFQEKRREKRVPGLLHADYLVLCSESEDDLKAMLGHFVEMCRRRGQKVN